MIKTCNNCGGLFADEPWVAIAGRICECDKRMHFTITDKTTMNQPEETKLLPCPFCGTNKPNLLISGNDNFVYCKNEYCWCRTASYPNSYSAIARWNTRTPNEATKEFLEDKARLDWLEKEKFIRAVENKSQPALVYAVEYITLEGDSLRTAISNAMKQEK